MTAPAKRPPIPEVTAEARAVWLLEQAHHVRDLDPDSTYPFPGCVGVFNPIVPKEGESDG